MTLLSRRGFASRKPRLPAVVEATFDVLVEDFATLHWPLREASGSSFAELIVGGGVHDIISFGELEYVNGTIAQQDSNGRCLGFGGGANTSRLEIAADPILASTEGGWFKLLQPDQIANKAIIVARHGDFAGGFGLEQAPNGALRGFRFDGSGNLVDITSATGLLVVGEPVLVGLTWGANGLRVWLGATVVASETTPTTDWASTNANNISALRWVNGADGYDGLGAHLMYRNTEPDTAEVGTVNLPLGLSPLLQGVDLGTVEENDTIVLDLRKHGHFKGTVTPNVVTQGGDGTAAVVGETVEYTAGATADPNGDSFGITAGDDRGTTPERTFQVKVVEPATAAEFMLVMGYSTSDLFTTTFQGRRVFYAFLNSTYEQTIDDYHAVGDKVLNVFTMREDNSGDLLDDWVLNDNFQAIADAIVAKSDVAGADGVIFDEFSLSSSGTPSNRDRAAAVIASMSLVNSARPNKLFLPLCASPSLWLTSTSIQAAIDFRAALDDGRFEFAGGHLYPECDSVTIQHAQDAVDSIAANASAYIPKFLPNYALGDGSRCGCANPPATAGGDSNPSGCATYSLDELITYTLNKWLPHADPPPGFCLWWKGSGHIQDREELYRPVLDEHYDSYV